MDTWGMPHKAAPLDPLTADNLPKVALPQRQKAWRVLMTAAEASRLAQVVPWMDSRSGEEGGAFLTATPAEAGMTMSDRCFHVALRFRLGLPVSWAEVCSHRTTSSMRAGSKCPCRLDRSGQHAILCKVGGGVTPIHDACCDRLYWASKSTGARSLREQVVPELATPKRAEPRADLEIWGLASEPRALFDLTVCAPFAARYQGVASSVAAGEARKRNEYPVQAGIAVQGVAVDVFGRIGPALHDTLTRWADLARQRDQSRGQHPRRWLHLWRTQLSVEIARGISRLIYTADIDTQPCKSVTPLQNPVYSPEDAPPSA